MTCPPRRLSLLSLPLELRHQIYAHLLTPGYIIIHSILGTPVSARRENCGDASAAAAYHASVLDADLCGARDCTPVTLAIKGEPFYADAEPASPWPMVPLDYDPVDKHICPAILRVCRQTHAEAAYMLYSCNTFDFVEKPAPELCMHDWWWFAQERKRVRFFLAMIGPLHAALVRRVAITCPHLQKVTRPDHVRGGVPALDPLAADTVAMLRRLCPGLRAVEMPLTDMHPLVEAVRSSSAVPTHTSLGRRDTEACVGLLDRLLRGGPTTLSSSSSSSSLSSSSSPPSPSISPPPALDIIVIPINQMLPQDQKLHDEIKMAGWKMGRDLVLQRKISWALRKSRHVIMNPSWQYVYWKLSYS